MHLSESHELELEALAQEVLVLLKQRTGRLVGLTVRLPPGVPGEVFREHLDDALTTVGVDFVDLTLEPGAGPPSILSSQFEPDLTRP